MKKFFEKHDLVKFVGIIFAVSILFTWIFSSLSYFNGSELATEEMTRVGLFDLVNYVPSLTIQVFRDTFIFLFVVAGFYKLLGTIEAYKKVTTNLANIFKGKEKIFVAISTLLFAVLASMVTDYIVLIAIVPFFISVLSKLKVDRITGLSATFGGILVGVVGATYSTKIVGSFVSVYGSNGVEYLYEPMGLILLLAIAYLLITLFTFLRMNKVSKNKEVKLLEDPFASAEEKTTGKKVVRKINSIPMIIVLVLTFLVIIMSFIGWESVFNVTLFSDIYNSIIEATVGNSTIFYSLLGVAKFTAFGNWDALNIATTLLIATLIIKIIYRIPMDRVLSEYGEGIKKFGKTAFVILLVYGVLVISLSYPVIPEMISWILEKGTNIGTILISGILGSLFGVDFYYYLSLISGAFTDFSNINVACLALQGAYGFISFVAPTSVILMLGLSMLDIKYTDWLKHIWKFALSLLVVIIIILAIIMYI